MERKIKVAWICHFSNAFVRGKINYRKEYAERLVRYIFHKPKKAVNDFSQLITNGINQFEHQDEIELHIIAPYEGIFPNIQVFENKGVYYHFFNSDTYQNIFQKYIFHKEIDLDHIKNRRLINQILDRIHPDIIHLIGAENPYYSLAGLDVDTKKYPLVLGLQTLMSDPNFKKRNPSPDYSYRQKIERAIILRTTYIMSSVPSFRKMVWGGIRKNAIFLNSFLFVGEDLHLEPCSKYYDFEYNAFNISKAVDLAIEAFAIVTRKYPKVTLHIIGGYSDDFKSKIDVRIHQLGIDDNVTFTGSLPSHEDVMNEVRKARFALLPLKVDYVSGTIREAMANGLPVVSTITEGTPSLNDDRQSILVSPIGDNQGMAENMIKLLESKDLADKMRTNAAKTCQERYGNKRILDEHVEIYRAIYLNRTSHVPIPSNLYDTNTEK